MANKHEIQRDFYLRQKSFKEQLKVSKINGSKYQTQEVLFDEELFPEFKDGNQVRTFFKKETER